MAIERPHILLLADDPQPALHALLARALPGAALRQRPAGRDPAAVVRDARPSVVLLAPCLTDHGGGEGVLRALAAMAPAPPVVALSAAGDARTAVRLLKHGAADWIGLADLGRDLPATVRALVAARPGARSGPLRRTTVAAEAPPLLVGVSPAIAEIRRAMETAADSDAPLLIEGETGTGKEIVARTVHRLATHRDGAFVPVNCAAIPESLAESELFGHLRGAFTGAIQDRPGAVQLADGGTLFLDELEELAPALQAKLLRVVQDGELRPVGAPTARRVDVRLISASNRDLWDLVERGRFRADLYYRLRVLTIRLPPLRERRDDVLALADHFVRRFNGRHGTSFRLPTPTRCRALIEHHWPGNVRELENALESLLVTARAARCDLAALLDRPAMPCGPRLDERAQIVQALDEHRWNRQRTATALGISRVTLWRRMERHGIRDPFAERSQDSAA